MEYENVDEVARRQACEKVKQIVKAIKAIKIKYYLNFSKISEKDRETYEKLEESLEKISNLHNLNNLRVALISEVNAKYDDKNVNDMNSQNSVEPDDILKKCYGAIDAQKDALSRGRITQALRCQEQLKRYRQKLDPVSDKEVTNYKREKFAELVQSREQVEEQIKSWNNKMKGMYKIKHVTQRRNIANEIKGINKETEKDNTKEEVKVI